MPCRYDNVVARQMPEQWNLSVLFLISSVLAIVALISSLLLLYLMLSSWVADSIFQVEEFDYCTTL